MTEVLILAGAAAAGGLLGVIFFGGLWLTLRHGLGSRQPALWFFGSLLVRMAVALAGFYFAAHGDWRRLLACLAGFLAARIGVIRRTRARDPSGPSAVGGGAA